jgi:membrane protease YdiL (CAAX protease family)
VTGGLRADRWLNLVGAPPFLAAVRSDEHSWRPVAAFCLIVSFFVILGLAGFLVSGLLNTWLIQALVLGQAPTWPDNLIDAARSGRVVCQGCLMGGISDTVAIAVVYIAGLIAVLAGATLIYHRPPITWVTAAPHFRWRLFWLGLVVFGGVLAVIVALPDALHGWPDRPVVLKADEAISVRLAYTAVMLLALPVAAAFEEVLCRGWLMQVTAAFTRSLPVIILVNSLIFALLHGDSDMGRNLARVVLGMVLSWGVLRTGGLEIGIGIHAANNIVILMLAQTIQQSEQPVASSPIAIAANLAVSLIALTVIELVARWGPLRRWGGLDLGSSPPQPPPHRANSTLAAP